MIYQWKKKCVFDRQKTKMKQTNNSKIQIHVNRMQLEMEFINYYANIFVCNKSIKPENPVWHFGKIQFSVMI